MKELTAKIVQLISEEYDRATEKFGAAHNSNHESYAVILEEYEEAVENSYTFKIYLENFWMNIKNNEKDKDFPVSEQNLPNMYDSAMYAACEWIQVAAMCHKAIITESR